MKRTTRIVIGLACTAMIAGAAAIVGCGGMRGSPMVRASELKSKPGALDGFSAMTPLLGDIPLTGRAFAGAGERGYSAPRHSTGLPAEGEASPRVVAEPPGLTLRPGDELWVIERRIAPTRANDDDTPGCGAMLACRDASGPCDPPPGAPISDQLVPVPLKHTDVSARIDGYISTTHVTQQFENPFSGKIEAVYIFPLPDDAAVTDFLMIIGERRIRGIIREREDAERIYYEAHAQGHVASLLTQERPNIFTQKVANIEPGKRIDVDITYFNTLAYRDGWFEWVFPMVVGPRFNPPGYTGGIGAVAQGAPGASGQKTEVQYLRPEKRSGHDIAVKVEIDAGVDIESVECSSHQVHVRGIGLPPDGSSAVAFETTGEEKTSDGSPMPHRATVTLSDLDTIPNRDFVLRYRVAGDRVKSALLTQADARAGEQGGFFTLMLVPPAELKYLPRGPLEMVFVIDCSGSMQGAPIAQAKRAVEHALGMLEPRDSFQVIDFSESASTLGSAPLAATPRNIHRGLSYVRGLSAGGGTMMINGIRAALGFPHDPERLRYVCFLTDGFIGNEDEILEEVNRALGDSRIFSFGMGSAPNRHLLEDMARLGRGGAAYVSLRDDAAPIMDLFIQRISHPAMTDLAIDWGGMQATDVYPSRLPDLFVGRPVILTGRYQSTPQRPIRVRGRAGPEHADLAVDIASISGERSDAHRSSLAAVWARQRIADLTAQSPFAEGAEMRPQITRTALDFGLMSAFTAFVAVDSLSRTAGDHGTTVAVPVPVPEGVRYDTTVEEGPQVRRGP